jgi:hypothetical protein
VEEGIHLVLPIVVPLLVRIDRSNLSLLKGADYLGMALMAVFLGCLEYTLEEGPRWDWFGDGTIRATAWIAAISGIAFVWRSLTHANPVVDLRALKSRNFALGCFFSFVTGVGIFATIYLTLLFLGRVRGFSALQIGRVQTAMAGGDALHGHAAALKMLWSLTWREAQTQAFADAFLVIMVCFVVATAMVPLMRKVAPPKGPSADAH